MKVGILGSGVVARTLAAGFRKHGHDVVVGTRDPNKLAEWAASTPDIRVGSFGDAAAFGDLIVLAVKGDAAEDVLQLAGGDALSGKVILDPTNPIATAPPVNGVLKYFTSSTIR